MLDPAVSVIIPAYQAGRFIETAIASVAAQTLDSWECVVVDDGSTDDTADRVRALAQHDQRVRLVSQGNRGLPAARNSGLRAARGEFIQFLDADDRIAPTKLARQRALMDADPSLDLVYGDVRYFDDEHPDTLRRTLGQADQVGPPAVSGRGASLVARLIRGNMMVVEAPLIRRRLLDAIGAFDEGQRYLEDWDLWLRCALVGAAFLFDPGDAGRSFVRVHATSMSADRRAMLRAEIALRRRLDAKLSDPVLSEANARGMASADAALLILDAPAGRLRDEVGRMAAAAIRWRQARWAVWVLVLPLMRFRLGRTAVERARRLLGAGKMA